jgi:integrase
MTRTSAPPSYLKQRSGTWYASMEIPSALRVTLGKRRFMASLCTRDRKKAELLKARHLVEWQHLIDRARLGADANTPLIQRMTAIYQQELDAAKACTPRDDEPDPVAHVKEEFAYVLADNYPPEVADEVHGVATGFYVIIRDHIDRLIESRTSNTRTQAAKRSIIQAFLDMTGIRYLHQWNRQSVRRYLQCLVDSGRSGSTASVHQAHLSAFYKDISRLHDYRVASPFDDVAPIAPKSTIETQAFTVRDMQGFWAATANSDLQLHELITLAAYTGCRYSELTLLKKPNLRQDHFVVTGAKTKAGNRTIPLHPEIIDLIHELANRSTDEYVIPDLLLLKNGKRGLSQQIRFGTLKSSLGYQKRVHSFHSIRATVATLMEQAGANPVTMHRLLGHGLSGETFGTYSGGASMTQLRETVELIDYR